MREGRPWRCLPRQETGAQGAAERDRLPGNATPAAGENARYQGASVDGATIAFKIAGTLYVRVHSGEAAEEETLKVAEGNPTYGGLSEDGTYLYYESGGDIHRYETANEADQEVNSSADAKMVNASADGSHVYFISPSQLDGIEGTAGKPNLYVWSGNSPAPRFIATVAPEDTEGNTALTYWSNVVAPIYTSGLGPGADPSRTTPDGKVLVFQSRAPIKGYDNAGYSEIYRYDDSDGSLDCISCNPAVTTAEGNARLEDLGMLYRTTIVRNLSDDGRRVFLETTEPLAEGDVDGVNDIYEWEEGEGSPILISSGESIKYPRLIQGVSPDPNVLMGVTPRGDDVFFISQDPLARGAGVGGAEAIYDARVGGGFPAPSPATPCLGEACRPAPSSPPLLTDAASNKLQASGNVVPKKKQRKHRHRCRRRHGRCHRGAARSSMNGAPVNGAAWAAGAPLSPADAQPAPPGETSTMQVEAQSTFGEFERFEIEAVNAQASTTAAAGHPDLTTDIELRPPPTERGPTVENLGFDLPPGLYGDPQLVPRCSTGEFLGGECPVDSQVGVVHLKLDGPFGVGQVPLFNLEPVHPEKEIARFGLMPSFPPVFIDVSLRTAGDYGVSATVHGGPSPTALLDAATTVWGNPADSSHNELRMSINEAFECNGKACVPHPTKELGPVAFMTNPSACGHWQVTANVTSYQLPGQLFSKSAPVEPGPVTSCQGLPFAPSFQAHPTSHRAGAPTGLNTVFKLPQTSDPKLPSTATMREARVILPAGMTINPGAADGLAACSERQVGYHEEVDATCPDLSKVGTATIASPALPRPLEGTIYLRAPRPGRQFGFWLVSDDLGLHVKLPGELEPDQKTGQVSVVFADLPQVPVEEVAIDVWGGDRAPLKNPDACGAYQTAFSFKPHSDDPAVSGQTQMTIDEGCGARGFSPQLSGGVADPRAGHYSPFLFDLVRGDSEQDLADLEVTLPAGELARLRGVALCPDADAAAGACPAGSQIGHLTAAAGSGPLPLWIPQTGKPEPAVYLAGPFDGAPYSIIATVPAQAGPFDLGNVVARSALEIDPETAVATVVTKPLPQIVEGVPISYRHLHVVVDRPEFTLNPTNCRELAITSTVTSTQGAVAHPSDRFEVEGCRALKFKPKLAIRLKGGTQRGDYPALSATLKARRGDANLSRVSVALPHSEFLAQEHIGTICTRVQFAADRCPKGSVYGRAKAWTPLLDKPLEGPVYLRSSDHPLPDLVMDLRGQIEIAVAGRIDSKHGGIRTTFETIPDAPISKFVLRLIPSGI